MAKRAPAPKVGGIPDLGMFDGKPVLGTSVAITNAGDGLSKAMTIEPEELHHGERLTVVIECEVTKIGFVPIKDSPGLMRVHTLSAGLATVIDHALVKELLDKQRQRLEEAAGVHRLPLDSDDQPGDSDLD